MSRLCAFCHGPIKLDQFDALLGGVTFRAWGDYGSEIFGKQNGSFIEMAVCDICLYDRHPNIKYYAPRLTPEPEAWKPEGKPSGRPERDED